MEIRYKTSSRISILLLNHDSKLGRDIIYEKMKFRDNNTIMRFSTFSEI